MGKASKGGWDILGSGVDKQDSGVAWNGWRWWCCGGSKLVDVELSEEWCMRILFCLDPVKDGRVKLARSLEQRFCLERHNCGISSVNVHCLEQGD